MRRIVVEWIPGLVLVACVAFAGCRERPQQSRPSSNASMSPPLPGGRLAPSRPASPQRPATPSVDSRAVVPGKPGTLIGLWRLERAEVAGMAVPLPKHFKIRLHFQSGGKLVVHGVKRTKATRTAGTWEASGGRLQSTVGGKKEIRTYVLSGDGLTLTQVGGQRIVWKMRRVTRTGQ